MVKESTIKIGDQGFIKTGCPFGKKGYTVTGIDENSENLIEILSWDSTDRRKIKSSDFEIIERK